MRNTSKKSGTSNFSPSEFAPSGIGDSRVVGSNRIIEECSRRGGKRIGEKKNMCGWVGLGLEKKGDG